MCSGDIDFKSSTQFNTSIPWPDLLERICFYGHFSGKQIFQGAHLLFFVENVESLRTYFYCGHSATDGK